MTTITLADNEAALILSPDSIQVCLPASFEEQAEDLGDGRKAIDTGEDTTHAMLIAVLAVLIEHDDEFVEYVFDRLVAIRDEVLPAGVELALDKDD